MEEGCQSMFDMFSDGQEVHLIAGALHLEVSLLVYVKHQDYIINFNLRVLFICIIVVRVTNKLC